jgi:hypothetical protein
VTEHIQQKRIAQMREQDQRGVHSVHTESPDA